MAEYAEEIEDSLDVADSQENNWNGQEIISVEGLGLADSTTSAGTFFQSLLDGLFIWDETKHSWVVIADDSLVINDTLEIVLGLIISEWITLVDSQSNNWNGQEIVNEEVELWDLCQGAKHYTDTLGESLAIDDVVTYKLTILALEYLGLTELVSAMKSCAESVSESVALTDSAERGFAMAVESILTVIDTSSVIALFIKTVQDALGLADAASLIKSLGVTVSDPLTFTETITSQGHFYSVIYDTLAMNCTVELNGEIWECYVLNTPKFHPSVYSGFNFNSYCVYENRAFAANDTGIYELTGNTDDGDTIHTGTILSATDFGSPNQKRFRRGYLGISGNNPMMILETEDGTRQAFNIDTQGKTVISSALKSKKWKLSLADFNTVDHIKLIPVILTK